MEQEKNNHGDGGAAPDANASVSWEEYKAEKKRAKEHRMSMRQREGGGEGGVLGMLQSGLGSVFGGKKEDHSDRDRDGSKGGKAD